MRRVILVLLLIAILSIPVKATEFMPPEAPESAQRYMPEQIDSFGEDLWYVITEALYMLQPRLAEAIRICVSLLSVSLLVGLFSDFATNVKPVIVAVGTVIIGIVLFDSMNAFIHLGAQTVAQISQYGKLLLPVMTGTLAAQGAVSKSSAIYLATAVFDSLLSTAVTELLMPMVYIFLCLSITCNVFSQPLLSQIQKFLKWLMTWGLKIVLYVFTGYIGITGVVGGTTDAALLKATKLTISGMVPVVGNIISDASEAILVSAGIMKNAAGIYGLLAIIAIWIGPFLQIGLQYILLKLTCGICEMFAVKNMAELMKDFSSAMGLVLAMTGTVCMIFLISTICFMKGAG